MSYGFLFWSYNVVWAGLAVYLLWIWRGVRRTDRRLQLIEEELEAGPANER